MNNDHQSRVAQLVSVIKDFYDRKVPFRIYRGATNATRIVSFETDKMVDVSDFNHVLGIDVENRVAVVEPNVAMDELVAATLPYGLVPPVVMEFPGITVGGGLQGGAGESSSYAYGTFNRTLEWYDVVLANGELVRASRTEHADLFWGTAGSYGSLGVVTAAAIQLIPAKRYVHLQYIPVHSFQEAIDKLTSEMIAKPDYIDGIMSRRDQGVIIIGNLSDEVIGAVQTFTRASDPWFYLHAKDMIADGQQTQDSVPLADYLFRYDRGAFWTGALAFKRAGVPFNRFTRWLLDPLLHTRKMYDALQASGMSQQTIIQDLAIPDYNAVAFMEYVDKQLGIYPMWLCPLLTEDKSPFLSSHLDCKTIINVGVWGISSPSYDEFVAANKQLEDTVTKLGGKKWLYANAFYDEPTFWKIYDPKGAYKQLRTKYHAETLPTVFDKVQVPTYYKVSTKKGALFALLGKSGIRKK